MAFIDRGGLRAVSVGVDERVTKHMAQQRLVEKDARKRVYGNMLPTYRKALTNIFVSEML